ncbi:hypothetical protein [Amycolatopsis vancoresmycina]|uniref:hypothetical protein n=1 Tax=Amycolatopsis vancoresmycina TaxID=208444 RepID=UPI0003A63698|nr:hypothetical protein [Amycolatopsis vancoresmycina]
MVTFGGTTVVSLGSAACLFAWLNGESLTVAALTSGAAVAALLNALVAMATFLAGHPRDASRRNAAEPEGADFRRQDQGPLRPPSGSGRPDLPEA